MAKNSSRTNEKCKRAALTYLHLLKHELASLELIADAIPYNEPLAMVQVKLEQLLYHYETIFKDYLKS